MIRKTARWGLAWLCWRRWWACSSVGKQRPWRGIWELGPVGGLDWNLVGFQLSQSSSSSIQFMGRNKCLKGLTCIVLLVVVDIFALQEPLEGWSHAWSSQIAALCVPSFPSVCQQFVFFWPFNDLSWGLEEKVETIQNHKKERKYVQVKGGGKYCLSPVRRLGSGSTNPFLLLFFSLSLPFNLDFLGPFLMSRKEGILPDVDLQSSNVFPRLWLLLSFLRSSRVGGRLYIGNYETSSYASTALRLPW